MFYTLTTKFVIKKGYCDKDYIYIYVIGSIGYIALHWYLHTKQREGIVGKITQYFYYLLAVDAIIAFSMYNYYVDPEKDTTQGNEYPHPPLTTEQKKLLMQRMQNMRNIQQQRMREIAEQNNLAKSQQQQPVNQMQQVPVNQSPPPKQNNDEKRSIFSKSEESRETNSSKNESDKNNDKQTDKNNDKQVDKNNDKQSTKNNNKMSTKNNNKQTTKNKITSKTQNESSINVIDTPLPLFTSKS